MTFADHLIKWYNLNHRTLPWRETQDPYRIWISEVILQQTRVAQGLSYYQKFLKNFPDIKALANAKEQDVLKTWQGLGYYSRARNLHYTAKQIIEKYNGSFPSRYEDILSLKGIGEYSAAAIASIAYGLPYPVIDGNVIRVVTRLFNIDRPPGSAEIRRKIKAALEEVIPHEEPGTFNQAIMEFGALVCIPKNPDCKSCILNEMCGAYKAGNVGSIPLKDAKSKPVQRYFNYFVFLSDTEDGMRTIIRKRTDRDIWKNLYDFPLIEKPFSTGFDEMLQSEEWKQLTGKGEFEFLKRSGTYRHKLSHQEIIASFHLLKTASADHMLGNKDLLMIKLPDIHNFPVSRLIEQFLEDENF